MRYLARAVLFPTMVMLVSGCLLLADHGNDWPCSSSTDCRSGERCGVRGTKKICLSDCLDASECDNGQVCRDSRCTYPDCTAEDASGCALYACDVTAGLCKTQCSDSSDCQPESRCQDGECVPASCSGPGECGGFQCRDGACVVKCAASWDCEQGHACVKGKCVAAPGIGVSCSSSQPCTAGECIDNRCGTRRSLCDGRSCGSDQGVSCGACSAKEYCSAQGGCLDACGDAVCGERNGVKCGTCAPKTYCASDGKCADACGAAVCGTHQGVSCGACASGYSCTSAGKCEEQICSPNGRFCVGATRYQCSPNGLNQSELETCGPSQCCSPDQCTGKLCAPGMPVCSAQGVFGNCGVDGCGPGSGATDCAAKAQQCDVQFGCVNIDEVATVVQKSPHTCYDAVNGWSDKTGLIISVTKSVHLLQFEQVFSMAPSPDTIRWFVYEATQVNGPYVQLFTKSTTESDPGNYAFIKSGTIDVTLTAGKYYLIGTDCGGDNQCWTMGGDQPGMSKNPSFGKVLHNVVLDCSPLNDEFVFKPSLVFDGTLAFTLWSNPTS